MKIFVSKTSDYLNKKVLDTEFLTPNICINPFYNNISIKNSPCNNIFCDSAAFQEREIINRISFLNAINRQLNFQKKLNCYCKYIASYDKINDGVETLKANKYLFNLEISNIKVLIIQGSNQEYYNQCLKETLKLYNKKEFILSFGGIAKIGSNSELQEKLFDTIEENLKELKEISHIHLFGCLTLPIILKFREYLPDIYLSVDTSGIEIKSVMGQKFINGKWIKIYDKKDKYINYHPCDLFKENCCNVIKFYKDI